MNRNYSNITGLLDSKGNEVNNTDQYIADYYQDIFTEKMAPDDMLCEDFLSPMPKISKEQVHKMSKPLAMHEIASNMKKIIGAMALTPPTRTV